MKIINKNSGQSLMEMVVSIGILMMSVAAILALTTSNVVGQKESEFQIIANNLAREGIEVIRNKRDSNWLAGLNWDAGLYDAVLDLGGVVIPVFDIDAGSWQLTFAQNDVNYRVFITNDGAYNQDGVGTQTIYRRYLKLQYICQGGTEYFGDSNCSEKIGLKIDSIIKWKEKGMTRQARLQDLLYAWK